MAVRSVSYNELEEHIKMIHGDIKDMPEVLGHGKYDVVTCNPPYFLSPSQKWLMPMNIWQLHDMKFSVRLKMLSGLAVSSFARWESRICT